jgi:hypothetical protein
MVSRWLIGEVRCLQRSIGFACAKPDWCAGWAATDADRGLFCIACLAKGWFSMAEREYFYALQRMVAEAVLSIMVLEEKVMRPCRPHRAVLFPRTIEGSGRSCGTNSLGVDPLLSGTGHLHQRAAATLPHRTNAARWLSLAPLSR